MDTIRLVSWNVNGFRALSGKPDWDWFASTDADVVALQETKAEPAQIAEEHRSPEGWNAEWLAAQVKKGYSGVAVFSRQKAALEPLAVHRELPDPRYQGEGRLLHIEYPAFHFFNVYFPNGTKDDGRLAYKMGYYDAFLAHAEELRRTKPIVVCGDFNTAHRPIDLARPKANEENSGFLPIERAWWTASSPPDTWTPSATSTATSRTSTRGGPTSSAPASTTSGGASTTSSFRRSWPRPSGTHG